MILIDVNNLAFRSQYAFLNLRDKNGRYTGCMYGFLKAVLQMKQKDNALTFCWDQGLPGDPIRRDWRKVRYPEYKATRGANGVNEAAVSVREQLRGLRTVIEWLGYQNIGVPGLEADDIISLLAHSWRKTPISIYSNDRDMYQLLTLPNTTIYHRTKFITGSVIEKEYGVPLTKWASYLAMGGDSSDNIKPMKGMGPKTAEKLVLAGADLTKPWGEQPAAIHLKWVSLATIWPRIQECYRMALLPARWDDECIRACTSACSRKYHKLVPTEGPVWESEEHRKRCYRRFMSFCSDHDLRDAIADRWKYFGVSEDQEDDDDTRRSSHSQPRHNRQTSPPLLGGHSTKH